MLGKSALALLRLVISSYFIAISLEIISGVNPGLVFQNWLAPAPAQFVGASLMAGCSLFIFMGLFLRLSCLYLALLVLASSVTENVLLGGIQNPEALWRDVVFVSALMLIYGNMSQRGLSRVALVKRARKVRAIKSDTPRVTPRRVPVANQSAQPATGVVQFPPKLLSEAGPRREEVSNIFCDNAENARQAAS